MILGLGLLFILPFLAGLSALKIKNPLKDQVQLLLAFSGAFLFSITVTHLIPGLFGEHHHQGHTHMQVDESLSLFVLLGFLIQLLLDIFSKGVEHGHIHPPENHQKSYIISIMTGLCLHAFIEGIPLGLDSDESQVNFQALLWGIILHKIPAAFVLGILLVSLKLEKRNIFLLLILFASMSPLSMYAAQLLDTYPVIYESIPIFVAIVAGSFLHISTTILLESGTKMHRISFLKFTLILLGFGLGTLLHFL